MSPETMRRRAVLPPAPLTLEESGLAFDTLLQMATKILHLSGEQSGGDLAARLGLRYAVIEPVLHHLRSTYLAEVSGSPTFPAVSSTDIRARLAQGESVEHLVPATVLAAWSRS